MKFVVCPIVVLLFALGLQGMASGVFKTHAAGPVVETTKEGDSVATTRDAQGRPTSIITKDKNGYVRSKAYFANGIATLKVNYSMDCGVGARHWKPELARVTVFRPCGKAALYKQSWACDDKGALLTLLNVDECDSKGRSTTTWSFGVKDKPLSVERWLKPGLVSEQLNEDGTVAVRTTYQPHKDPVTESFTGNKGGTRIIDPSLTKFPSNLAK